MIASVAPAGPTVDLVNEQPRGLAPVQRRAVSLLKKYVGANDTQKTAVLRDLAECLVEARGLFQREDGSPDWKGRSYAYRIFVRDLYDGVAYSKEQQNSVQAAVRYHIGAVLRDRLDEKTLADYDLLPKSPRERGIEQRANRSALLSALTAREIAGGALLGLSAAYTVLSRLDSKELDHLDGNGREVARATLADLERRVRALRKTLG